jgi:hypothetical protein
MAWRSALAGGMIVRRTSVSGLTAGPQKDAETGLLALEDKHRPVVGERRRLGEGVDSRFDSIQ